MAGESATGAHRVAGTDALAGAGTREEVMPPEVVRAPVPEGSRATRDVDVTVTGRNDRVRWGSVWAGVIVALPTFLLLELALFAVGGLDLGLDPDASATTAGLLTGVIALFAFFLGGLTAGASAMWKGVSDGLLHGILVWSLALVGVLFFTLLGGGTLLGPVSDVVTQVGGLQQQLAQGGPDVDLGDALSTARDAAGWAVLGLGLSIAASAIGGMVGAKIWPRGNDTQEQSIDVR